MAEPYALSPSAPVAALGTGARADFIVRTYRHLLGAILAFAAIETWLFTSGRAEPIARAMWSVNWLWILGAFMIVAWFASRVAHRAVSPAAQYAALAGFVVAEAVIFVPLLYLATTVGEGVIPSAAFATLAGFTGLSAIAFFTRKDFSFLRGIVFWGMLVALLLIVASLLFGFQLGTIFSVVMIALAGAAILYDTSKVIHHYPPGRHVAAALELFASTALMFWYVLRLFTSFSQR